MAEAWWNELVGDQIGWCPPHHHTAKGHGRCVEQPGAPLSSCTLFKVYDSYDSDRIYDSESLAWVGHLESVRIDLV